MKAKMLPIVKHEGKDYFFDARCKQLRSAVPFPEIIDFINLTDIEVMTWENYVKEKNNE